MNDHSKRTYDSMLGLLCNEDNPTPLVRINEVTPFKHTQVFAKLEWYNPFGSVKDRVAANLISSAEEDDTLGAIKKLVEPTSGNTGMGLAMIGNLKGYSLTTPLSKAIPLAKRTALRFFGCEVIELDDALCPAPGAPEGAMQRAQDIAAQPDFHQLNQYANPNNPEAHVKTTGPEIWKQSDGEVTHFVAGLGTCGTITGTGRFLKSKNKSVQVLGVHPANGHDIPGVRSIKQLALADFYLPDEYDGQIEVSNEEAYELALRLNREEGIIAGPSSAMALAGAFKMIPDEPGLKVVVIFPDNIFKYCGSVAKHLPELFPGQEEEVALSSGLSAEELLVQSLIANARSSVDAIEVAGLQQLLGSKSPPVLLDVRPAEQFARGHIHNSINIALADLNEEHPALPARDSTVVSVCNAGNMSLTGLLIMKSLGFQKVKSLSGGVRQWTTDGYELRT